jgi:tRNA-2-methylthio-N6-dimethylallyladenosine synthase/ribosomal protein S12 methylthiotransferase
MYLYPAGLTEGLLRELAGLGAPLLPYFDVPLQHADPEILKSMGRPFAGDPRKVVDRIRSVFPEAALRTSLIVGYPGETPARFRARQLVSEIRSTIWVLAYCPERARPPAGLSGQVSEKIRPPSRGAMGCSGDHEELSRLPNGAYPPGDAPEPDRPGFSFGRPGSSAGGGWGVL